MTPSTWGLRCERSEMLRSYRAWLKPIEFRGRIITLSLRNFTLRLEGSSIRRPSQARG
jgi:hypothetical protein